MQIKSAEVNQHRNLLMTSLMLLCFQSSCHTFRPCVYVCDFWHFAKGLFVQLFLALHNPRCLSHMSSPSDRIEFQDGERLHRRTMLLSLS